MPQNGENAYLGIKNPRASRALRQALDPGQSGLTSFVQLCCAKLAKRSKILGLDPPLQKAEYGPGLCDVSMTSSIDITYHMTYLDMQCTIVAFNLELTTVWHAWSSHSHASVDGACACKKKWFLKNTLPAKYK